MLKQRLIDDEELEKPFNAAQFKRLMGYAKPYKKQMFITLVLMIIASVCGLLGPYFLQLGIDNYIVQGDYIGLAFIAMAFLSTNFISMICMRRRIRIMSTVGQDILFRLRQDLFNHIQTLSFTFYDSRPTGKILVRIINDVNSLGDLLTKIRC